jgi:hypothetical protein
MHLLSRKTIPLSMPS